MIVQQRRSGKRHLVAPDGLATRCGRILHRTKWKPTQARICDCRMCLAALMAWVENRQV